MQSHALSFCWFRDLACAGFLCIGFLCCKLKVRVAIALDEQKALSPIEGMYMGLRRDPPAALGKGMRIIIIVKKKAFCQEAGEGEVCLVPHPSRHCWGEGGSRQKGSPGSPRVFLRVINYCGMDIRVWK